jgi:CdiI immunity protein
MNTKNLINLEYYLSNYFHQDWCEEFQTSQQVLIAFCEAETTELISGLTDDINLLLLTPMPSTDLDQRLVQLGSFFEPSGEGVSARMWLEGIVKTILILKAK